MSLNLLGAYGLLAPLADLDQCTDDLVAMGYDGASVILDNRWVQPPEPELCDFWWVYDKTAKAWDMKELNDRAFKRFRQLCELCAIKDLALFVKFQSVYYKSSWNKFPIMKQKSHPFVNNTFGLSMDGDPRQLYDSITFGPLKFHWLKWEIISEAQNKFNFLPNNKLGVAMIKAYRRLIRIIADVKGEHPSWVFGYAPNNEEQAGKLGDRSEVHSWFHDEFKKHGLDVDVAGFHRVVNRQGDTAQMKQIHADCGKKWGQNFGLEAIHEVHVDSKNDPVLIGLSKNRTFASGDGAPEDANFVQNMRDLGKAGYAIFDAKYWEGINGIKPVPPYKWMANWNRAAKEHEAIIK